MPFILIPLRVTQADSMYQQALGSAGLAANAKLDPGLRLAPSTQFCRTRQSNFDRRSDPVFPTRSVTAQGLGEDVLSSWGDIASLVASEAKGNRTPFDDLASKLGKILYADLGGWHLRLSDLRGGVGDLKMHQVLAQALGKNLENSSMSPEELLRKTMQLTPVSLGNGNLEVQLLELVPDSCIAEAAKLLRDWKP